MGQSLSTLQFQLSRLDRDDLIFEVLSNTADVFYSNAVRCPFTRGQPLN
jgi:hypothetical protein